MAALADISGAGRQLIQEITGTLQDEGLLDKGASFENVEQMLDGLEAVHNNNRPSFLQPREGVHPVVLTNPITGRKSLYVNSIYTQRLIGLSEKESDATLRFLFDHVNTPEFHVRMDWKLGYVGVWHQQVTQHRGVADFTGPRKLKRLTILGGPLGV